MLWQIGIVFEFKLRNVRIVLFDEVFLVIIACTLVNSSVGHTLYISDFEYLKLLLLSVVVMLSGSPVVVKLHSNFAVSLFLVSFHDEWMLQQLRPGESLIGSFIQQAL